MVMTEYDEARLIHKQKPSLTYGPTVTSYLDYVRANDDEAVEKIFRLFQETPESPTIHLDLLNEALNKAGLRLTDRRLRLFVERQRAIQSPQVDMDTLARILGTDLRFITATLQHKLIIPDFPSFVRIIQDIYYKSWQVTEGKVASYIPELAKVRPNNWGVSVCTVDGQRYSKGDALVPFTIQSCSKPFTYALALQLLGSEKVHEYVGHEPSGRMFNALELDVNDKPHNPMINPGAIVVCAVLQSFVEPKRSIVDTTAMIMDFLRKLAADEYVGYNHDVFVSEKNTGFRNYAIAYLMMEKKCFPNTTTVDDILSLYFQTCSIEGNCETLAVIAATLANGGVCPITNEVVMRQDVVRDVLSLMQSCGMYDYSGQFAFQIGLPAKSGVSGAILLVVPSIMGVGLWSPPLDPIGNSVRALHFCQLLLQYYCLHPYARLGHADPEKEDPTKRPGRVKDTSVLRILFVAARGELDTLRIYYMRGLNMGIKDYDNRTPLHLAAAEGQLECVRFLLEVCKVDPNPKDRHGHTPLTEAEMSGHKDVVEYLGAILSSENPNFVLRAKEDVTVEVNTPSQSSLLPF